MNSQTREKKTSGHSVRFKGNSQYSIKCSKSDKLKNLYEVYLCPEQRKPGRPSNKYVGSLPLEPSRLYQMLPRTKQSFFTAAKTIKLKSLYLEEQQIRGEFEISTAEGKEIQVYKFPSCFISGELSLEHWQFVPASETENLAFENQVRDLSGDARMASEDLTANINPKTSIAALSGNLAAVMASGSDSTSASPMFLELFEEQLFREIGLGVWRYNNKNLTLYGAFKDWLVGFDKQIDNRHAFLMDNIHSDERAEVESQLELCLTEKREVDLEFRILGESGTCWLSFRGRPFRNEIVGIAWDITELKKTQAANQALLSAIPDMLFKLDNRGVYLEFISPSGKKPYVSAEELLGKTLEEVLPSKIALEAKAALDKVLETGSGQKLVYSLDEEGQKISYYEARLVRCGEEEALAIVRDITEEMTLKKNFLEQSDFLKCMNGELTSICYNFFMKGRQTGKDDFLFLQAGEAERVH